MMPAKMEGVTPSNNKRLLTKERYPASSALQFAVLCGSMVELKVVMGNLEQIQKRWTDDRKLGCIYETRNRFILQNC